MIEDIWPGHRYWRGTPIRAKITNTKTGISVIVYITDTCGCYSGTKSDRSDDKIIDLSPKVFKALGVPLSRGIQKVTVEILR
jgi:rare lipoprotein A (peptidoglycan hydrolase)